MAKNGLTLIIMPGNIVKYVNIFTQKVNIRLELGIVAVMMKMNFS